MRGSGRKRAYACVRASLYREPLTVSECSGIRERRPELTVRNKVDAAVSVDGFLLVLPLCGGADDFNEY